MLPIGSWPTKQRKMEEALSQTPTRFCSNERSYQDEQPWSVFCQNSRRGCCCTQNRILTVWRSALRTNPEQNCCFSRCLWLNFRLHWPSSIPWTPSVHHLCSICRKEEECHKIPSKRISRSTGLRTKCVEGSSNRQVSKLKHKIGNFLRI